MQELFRKTFGMYRDGFAEMKLGRTLWIIILLKLFVLFCIIKPFFFPDFLKTRFQTNDERAAFVFRQLNLSAMPVSRDAPVLHAADWWSPVRPAGDVEER